MAGSVSDAVRVTARILPAGAVRREFGNTLFLDYVTTVITGGPERALLQGVRSYGDLASLTADGQPQSVVDAATTYFQQEPYPKTLLVGSVIAAAHGALIAGSAAGTVTAIEALGDNVAMNLDGEDLDLDLDGLASYTAIAAEIQTGVRTTTGHSAAVAAYDANSGTFILTDVASFGTGFGVNPATTLLGLGAGAGVYAPITVAETPDVALSRIEADDCNFFGIGSSPSIAQSFVLADSVRDWAAARPRRYFPFFDLVGSDVLVTAETTSIGAQLAAQRGDGVGGFYNGGQIDHKALSYLGRFSSINYDQPNAVINGKFLSLPGTRPTTLTATQANELDRKRINWYAQVGRGTDADTREGKTFGTWVDVYIWLAWFKDALEVAGYNFLKSTAGIGGVPITDQGLAAIADVLEAVCERGVRNGGIAPNFVSPAMRLAIQRATGNPAFDGFLSSGYLVVRPLARDVDQQLRETRGPIPVSIFVKGSGKVNFLDVDVTFEN